MHFRLSLLLCVLAIGAGDVSANRNASAKSLTKDVARRGRAARQELVRATLFATARGKKQGHWEYAVGRTFLRRLGMSDNDLRWLVAEGLLAHRVETTKRGAARRTFAKTKSCIQMGSCFMLTEAGMQWASDDVDTFLEEAPAVDTPIWNPARRELHFQGSLLKRFRTPAGNQTLVLDAFQEEGWPEVIADPLPPAPGIDVRRRLADTIKGLNRSQKPKLRLHFGSDGTGEGVLWRATQ